MTDFPPKLRVLHLFPEFKRGGAQINVLRFIKESPEMEHHVAAQPFDDSLEQEYLRESVQIHPIDMTSVQFVSIVALIKVIRSLKPDILHVNGKGAAFYGFITSFFTGKHYRIYHTMRGFHIKFSGLKLRLYLYFEKLCALRFDGNIMVSPSEKALLNEKVPGLPQDKLLLIPNGIDVKDVPLPDEIKQSLDSYKRNIVSLSRLSHQKDLITMIRAFNLCAEKHSDLALHIMGGETPQDKEYAESVRACFEESPYKDRIHLWGSVKDAGSLIRYFDLYWSTALFEGLPTAVVEAALCRTLIVGTLCVGNQDIIIPGKTGFLTEVKNPENNADQILKALAELEAGNASALLDEAERLCLEFSTLNNASKLRKLYLGSIQ